jgi:hypothetical protein
MRHTRQRTAGSPRSRYGRCGGRSGRCSNRHSSGRQRSRRRSAPWRASYGWPRGPARPCTCSGSGCWRKAGGSGSWRLLQLRASMEQLCDKRISSMQVPKRMLLDNDDECGFCRRTARPARAAGKKGPPGWRGCCRSSLSPLAAIAALRLFADSSDYNHRPCCFLCV